MSLMVLSTATPPRSGASRRPVGRPVGQQTRAIESAVIQLEDTEAWVNARALARRVHLSVVADRPDLALASAGAIVGIADRRLRQLGGGDDAA